MRHSRICHIALRKDSLHGWSVASTRNVQKALLVSGVMTFNWRALLSPVVQTRLSLEVSLRLRSHSCHAYPMQFAANRPVYVFHAASKKDSRCNHTSAQHIMTAALHSHLKMMARGSMCSWRMQPSLLYCAELQGNIRRLGGVVGFRSRARDPVH